MNKVRETLTGLKNVDSVTVDFDAKTALVKMKSGELGKTEVEKALKEKGFVVTSFDRVAEKKEAKKEAKQEKGNG
ncbi:MAG: cation transporter [Planctomycetes bacterium]|nr:cation transporter [Planctomycetota bacterium]